MARQLRKAGWPKARALIGGWQAWIDAGMPLEDSTLDPDYVTLTRARA